MAAYYYILASLPYLHFQVPPPLSHDEFIELCRPWMDARAHKELLSARLDIDQIPLESVRDPLLKKWIVFEHSLRTELVEHRSSALGVAPESFLRDTIEYDPSVAVAVREALEGPNPLAIELKLLELRWHFLTGHEVSHYFDLTALITVALKLQLLERMASFDAERGRRLIDSLHEEISIHGTRKSGNDHRDYRQHDYRGIRQGHTTE
jgi:hypothetical protein